MKKIIVIIIISLCYFACRNAGPQANSSIDDIKTLLFEQERFSDAIALAEKALQNNMNDSSLLYLRGMARLALKHYDAAMSDFISSMKTDPNNPLAYNGIGNIFYLNYEDYLAEHFWQKGLSLANTPSSRALFLGNLSLLALNSKKYDSAIKHLEEALSASRDGRYLNILGRVYLAMNKAEKAKEIWLSAINDASLPWAQRNFKHNTYYRLAELYASKKENREALTYCTSALEMSPSTAEYQKLFVKLKETIK